MSVKSKNKYTILFIPAFLALQACAHNKADTYPVENTVPKYEEAENVSVESVEEKADKFESFNRFSFEFNNQLDRFILRPLAVGYRSITTKYIRDRVNSALTNIKEPVSSVNNMLQGEFSAGLKNIGRFAINTTLGLVGTYDVAAGGFSLTPAPTNFDKTLAKWCIKDGPFIVLPIFGPTTPRAFIGDTVDGLVNPVVIATYNDANYRDKILYPYAAVSAIALREASMDLIDDFKKNSVDFYATVRSAYIQNRMKINRCETSSDDTEISKPNYDFDFYMDDEE